MTENLADIITREEPLGPLTSDGVRNPALIELLFCKENFIFSQIGGNPSIIVGRRGAGKTTFLRLASLNSKDKVIVELKPEVAFSQIVESIEGFGKGVVFPEEVCSLWNMLFWTTLFVALLQDRRWAGSKSENLVTTRKYVNALGLSEAKNSYSIMRKVIDSLKVFAEGQEDNSLSENIQKMTFHGVTFKDAQNSAIAFMRESSVRSMILFDSLEDFRLDNETMPHAISGLLKCQGSFSAGANRCTLISCLPAELYFPFLNLSSNPSKDFQHEVTLHWHAKELLRLSAERHLQYMKLFHEKASEHLFRINLSRKSGLIEYWENILPEKIINRIGTEESTIAYILRHTQLLPRQLLIFLNEICKESDGEDIFSLKSRPNTIVNSILCKEERLTTEIFTAFKYAYPNARQACERSIPYLPFHFPEGDLFKVYNKHGKELIGIHDFEEYKRMMFEIGAIGLVTGKTERYVEGKFEYTAEFKLISGSNDELCLHPLFTEVFRAAKLKDDPRVVYPFGSNVDEPDWRQNNMVGVY
jgi:hypothetical protein